MNCSRLLSTLLLILCASTTEAATRYVATTGADSGNCTNSASPCLTITYAVTQVSDGDTITVADGDYTIKTTPPQQIQPGTVSIVISNKDCPTLGCTIQATDGLGEVTVDGGTGSALSVVGSDGWTIKRLHFYDTQRCWEGQDFTGLTIEDVNCFYTGAGTDTAILVRNGATYTETRVNVRQALWSPGGASYCAIDNNSKNIFYFLNINGLTQQQSFYGYDNSIGEYNTVTNGTFKRNEVRMWTEHGILLNVDPTNVVIENNIFAADPGCLTAPILFTGPRVLDLYECNGCIFRNNLVAGHGFGIVNPGMYAVYTDPAQRGTCSGGHCTRNNIKIYNNLFVDPSHIQGSGTSISTFWHNGSCFTGDADESPSVQTDLFLDYNMYSLLGFSQPTRWKLYCGGGPGDVTWPSWQGASGWGGTANLDPNSSRNDPTFINYPSGGNYRAPSRSALQVDRGGNGTDAQGVARCATEDFDGNLRNDGICDIGPFEFGGGGGGPPPPPPVPEQPTPRTYHHLSKNDRGRWR